VRSSRLEGRPVFVQSLIGYNFWLGEGFYRFGPERYPGEYYRARIALILDKAGLDPAQAGTFYWTSLTPEQSARTEPRLQREALHRIADAPMDYAWRLTAGIYGFWTSAAGARRTWQYRAATLPFLLLGLWGAICVWRDRGPPGVDLLGSLAVLTVVLHNLAYAAIVAMARNSVQVYPALGYLVGVGVYDLVQRARATRWVRRP
jgi:hypothetical protein